MTYTIKQKNNVKKLKRAKFRRRRLFLLPESNRRRWCTASAFWRRPAGEPRSPPWFRKTQLKGAVFFTKTMARTDWWCA